LVIDPSTNNGLSDERYTTTNDSTLIFINVSPPESPIIPGYDGYRGIGFISIYKS